MVFDSGGPAVVLCNVRRIIRSQGAHVNVLAAFFPGFLQLNRFPDFAAFFRDFQPATFSRRLQGACLAHVLSRSALPAQTTSSSAHAEKHRKNGCFQTKNAARERAAQNTASHGPTTPYTGRRFAEPTSGPRRVSPASPRAQASSTRNAAETRPRIAGSESPENLPSHRVHRPA